MDRGESSLSVLNEGHKCLDEKKYAWQVCSCTLWPLLCYLLYSNLITKEKSGALWEKTYFILVPACRAIPNISYCSVSTTKALWIWQIHPMYISSFPRCWIPAYKKSNQIVMHMLDKRNVFFHVSALGFLQKVQMQKLPQHRARLLSYSSSRSLLLSSNQLIIKPWTQLYWFSYISAP